MENSIIQTRTVVVERRTKETVIKKFTQLDIIQTKYNRMTTMSNTKAGRKNLIFSHVKYEHLLAGISGGVTSTLILHPLDLIKIRFAGKFYKVLLFRNILK